MTHFIPMLYHWTPAERHEEISRQGLRVYSKPTVQSGRLRWPYICAGFTPSGAWSLSGDFMRDRDTQDPYDEWDLWQIVMPDGAQWEIRAEFGPKMQEIKIYTSLPPHSMWYVATRKDLVAID